MIRSVEELLYRKGVSEYRADRRVLRLFGLVERMDKYRTARRMSMAEVSGGRVRSRPWLGWTDGEKVALGSRGMAVGVALQ